MSTDAPLRRTRLDAGLRIVTESLPHLRSVAIGFWVGTGSRDEVDALAGASHFLEHLLFKGTVERSAQEIAESIESVGGDMNAFTTQEYTAFYVRVPDTHLDLALEILSDVVWSPAIRGDEMESERDVILEEIRMHDDAPDEVLHELLAATLFPEHPLGRSVLGSPESIGAITCEQVAAYHAEHYQPANVVVAAAGNLEHEHVVRLVERGLAESTSPAGALRSRDERPLPPPRRAGVLRRPTEQAHLALGLRALRRDDPDRYALTLVNQVLGGGMASRLFQEVRERRGLAYSVYSYRSSFVETGALTVYAGTTPTRATETLGVLHAELDRLAGDHGVSERELDAAKGALVGSMALGLETSASRMHRLGRNELTLGEIPSLDELVAIVEAVTPADVARVVDRVFGPRDRTLTVVGPFDPTDFA